MWLSKNGGQLTTNMNINFRYIIISLAVLLGLCTACSDEASDGGLMPDTHEGLTLYVPAANRFNSRAIGDNSDELIYTSLFLFAFPESGSPQIISLTTDNSPLDFVETYRRYPIDLEQGKYRFFVVANIFDADADVTTLPQTEAALRDEIITYTADYNCLIPDKGLPMSGVHTDFFAVTPDGVTQSMTDNEPFDYTGEAASIYAVMTFACAKVTIIPQDIDGLPIRIAGVEFGNLSQSEPLLYLNQDYNYGTLPSVTPDMNGYDNADPTSEAGTFYIPERYVSEAAHGSYMTFNIGDKDITLPLGEIADTEPGDVLPAPAIDDVRMIRRGTHYRYTLVTSDRIDLVVTDWTPELIAATLNGPVFLHVEKQVYEVTAGVVTSIWYDSDADDVHVKSPKYSFGGQDYDLFEYSIDASQDSIRVWVNPAIPVKEYEEIKRSVRDGEGKYDYIHIIAGNINKKITIYPLNLDNYFEVDPTSVTINVRLRVASGEYQGELPVNIHTNYPKVMVALADGWDNLPADDFRTPEDFAIKIRKWNANTNEFSDQVTRGNPVTVDVNGDFTYAVSFRGLNSGLETWTENRTLTFTITPIDENGNLVEGKRETVTINVIPTLSDYTIYFKADGWDNPHIYVYQCLEFPADYEGTWQNKPLADQPIGYRWTGGDGTVYKDSALEYSFTGKITFRGWGWPYNFNTIYNPGGSPKSDLGNLIRDTGLYMFDDGNDMTWRPSERISNLRYNKEIDYCKDFRNDVVCGDCRGGNNNPQWPGIGMKRDADGWFYFELTDIAEPGKTLIMFANGHFGDANRRFPKDNEVGIPLFDFPQRKGWLKFNQNADDRVGNQFVAEKPE